jgi:hypothetical protein
MTRDELLEEALEVMVRTSILAYEEGPQRAIEHLDAWLDEHEDDIDR